MIISNKIHGDFFEDQHTKHNDTITTWVNKTNTTHDYRVSTTKHNLTLCVTKPCSNSQRQYFARCLSTCSVHLDNFIFFETSMNCSAADCYSILACSCSSAHILALTFHTFACLPVYHSALLFYPASTFVRCCCCLFLTDQEKDTTTTLLFNSRTLTHYQHSFVSHRTINESH